MFVISHPPSAQRVFRLFSSKASVSHFLAKNNRIFFSLILFFNYDKRFPLSGPQSECPFPNLHFTIATCCPPNLSIFPVLLVVCYYCCFQTFTYLRARWGVSSLYSRDITLIITIPLVTSQVHHKETGLGSKRLIREFQSERKSRAQARLGCIRVNEWFRYFQDFRTNFCQFFKYLCFFFFVHRRKNPDSKQRSSIWMIHI